ncbi:MAG: lysylphosphatidylglycerol synthase transmembrane domain-containing protein [Vicinamibacteria bacterium]
MKVQMRGTPGGSVSPENGTESRRSLRLQSLALGLIGLVLLVFFFKDADFAAIAASLSAADGWLIALAISLTMVSYLVRALRWRYLLAPVGAARLRPCFETTVIGFMVNFLVPPGRLGEFARPYLLARREGLSASSAFATVFLERVLDLATVVLLVGGWLSFGPTPPGAGSEEAVYGLKVGGLLAFAGVGLGLGVMFWFARNTRRGGSAFDWVETMIRKLPAKVADPAFRFIKSFGAGLGVLEDRRNLARAGLLSLVLWVNISFALWLAIHAFQVEISFGATFLVIGFLTVGVAVPTPGAVGGYHVMCALALTLMFGVNENTAKAIALASHAIAFIPVSALGMVYFIRDGMSLRDIRSIRTAT